MDLRKAAVAIAVLLLISAAFLTRRRENPPEPVVAPMASFLTDHKNSTPRKTISTAKPGLVAPRLKNL